MSGQKLTQIWTYLEQDVLKAEVQTPTPVLLNYDGDYSHMLRLISTNCEIYKMFLQI